MNISGFSAPIWFALLTVVVVLILGYLWMQRRRHRHAIRFANLAMLERVAPQRPGWKRHVPVALLLVALVLFTVALAGPVAETKVPRNRATVMLVIDVSLSMKATDIKPNRLAAAQVSATEFARNMTPGINLGLISFAGTATVLVSPTTDRPSVTSAIAGLSLAESTGTGEAIAAALSSIESFGKVVGGAQGPPPARIVLMTDGKETVQVGKAFEQAEVAGQRKIPISAISFGTDYGEIELNGVSQPVPADDESMREIAALSGGEFHEAASAEQLREVYATLGEQIGYEIKELPATRPWLIAGTVTAIIAAAAALLIGQRLP